MAEDIESIFTNNQAPEAMVVDHPVRVDDDALSAAVSVGFADAVIVSATVGG